jgi:hypothetical protein
MKQLTMFVAAALLTLTLSAAFVLADQGTSSSKGNSSGGNATSSGAKPQPRGK